MPHIRSAALLRYGLEPNPVIDAYKAGVDVSRLRANRRLTVQQRMDQLVEMQRLPEEAVRAGRRDLEMTAELELLLDLDPD